MRVLSLTATSRLAERTVRQADQESVPVEDLVTALASFDVDHDRARAGIRLALTIGRLIEDTTDDEQRPCVRARALEGAGVEPTEVEPRWRPKPTPPTFTNTDRARPVGRRRRIRGRRPGGV